MKQLITFFALVFMLSGHVAHSRGTSSEAFTTSWKLKGAQRNFTLTLDPAFSYAFNYRLFDSNNKIIKSAFHTTGNLVLKVRKAGTYTLEITGAFPHFFLASSLERLKLTDVKQWGSIKWESMNQSFREYAGTGFSADDTPDLSNCNDMSCMFALSSFNQDISNWDVSNVTLMQSTFASSTFNKDISKWDVSHVTTMREMFASTFDESKVPNTFNQDIGNWNVSSVTDMSYMFSGSAFNQAINNWSVDKVTNMAGMFFSSAFNHPISSWHVSGVTNMSFMFSGSAFNQDIAHWDVSHVTTMIGMFESSLFNQDISNWNVEKVTNMLAMFSDSPFNQNISNWNVSNVNNMTNLFNSSLFNQDIGDWDVSNVTDMSGMFIDSALSSQNYDNTLINWAKLPNLENNVSLAATSPFCKSKAARNLLKTHFGWTIIDRGQSCPSVETEILSFGLTEKVGSATLTINK